ncbi:phosphoribosyltransferase [Fibrisoma limi BUZ 3]|uniref:Phosphoribosyltransferase n=1 Tax=Fibrisoma limi BUZ 3 TaxID=1185876 RepID=I2GJ80_9BACT|nr:phosphoribosyltransferase [Fibrisoma limi BUZ 3]
MKSSSTPLFLNRYDAGQQLAEQLTAYADRDDVLVMALPRGGVPVGYEVAQWLHVPLDVFLVRKLGVPGQEELAMGAIAAAGAATKPIRVLNRDVIRSHTITTDVLETVTKRELRELERRDQLYRGGRAVPTVASRVVILVDDGLATGATMRAAIAALRVLKPAEIVIAVPVAVGDVCTALTLVVDSVVCIATPEPFYGVGLWYTDFSQTTDDEVRSLLAASSC